MMQLIIEGKPAAIKSGSSFEYVSENRFFSDADAYTLSISLPLRGCRENLEIFGPLNRMDINSRQFSKNAELRFGNVVKSGMVTIVGGTETELKVQFLEGKSSSNFNPDLDKNYINELNLGDFPSSSSNPPVFQQTIDNGVNYVALMWSNGASGWYDNNVSRPSGNNRVWLSSSISFMPYLLFLTKKICQVLGYTCDFSKWEASADRYLLCCNTLPPPWGISEIARPLPHWTVNEFFAELEKLLACEFVFDSRAGVVSMDFVKNIMANAKEIKLKNVVDSFSCEVKEGDSSNSFRPANSLKYAERGSADEDPEWARDCCDWLLGKEHYRTFNSKDEFNTFFNYLKEDPTFGLKNYGPLTPDEAGGAQSWSGSDALNGLFYVADVDEFYIFKIEKIQCSNHPLNYTHVWTPVAVQVNPFGGWISSDPNAREEEVKCLPVRIAESNGQPRILLTPKAFGEPDQSKAESHQPYFYRMLQIGHPGEKTAYFDKIFLAYWDPQAAARRNIAPYPNTDARFNLASRHFEAFGDINVNSQEILSVSWLANELPDVRSIFHIEGKRYLCEKITATFTENGMSQLLKGEFHPLI